MSEQENAQPEDPSERRKYQRKVLRTSATVTLSDAQSFEVRTLDLSIGGMAIVAPANPKPGVTFTIRFQVPLGHKAAVFEAKARVVHSIYAGSESGFKIGLNFTQVSPESFAVAQKYLG